MLWLSHNIVTGDERIAGTFGEVNMPSRYVIPDSVREGDAFTRPVGV